MLTSSFREVVPQILAVSVKNVVLIGKKYFLKLKPKLKVESSIFVFFCKKNSLKNQFLFFIIF
jgi:hypothetical protein